MRNSGFYEYLKETGQTIDWQPPQYSEAYLKASRKILGDNFLDPTIPEHLEIRRNQALYEIWSGYVKIANDRSHIVDIDADNEFGLNIHTINRHYYFTSQLADHFSSTKDSFLFGLQSTTAWIHDYKKLHIPTSLAYAIANPDNCINSDEAAIGYGIMFYGAYAYDMEMDITLDLSDYEEDAKAFSFYFALKTSQINLMEIPKFLEYQLKTTFKDNISMFKSFLKALMRQYKTIDVDGKPKEVIILEVAETINDWITDFYEHIPIKTSSQRQESFEIDSSQKNNSSFLSFEREIVIDEKYLPYVESKLKPYFSDEDFILLIPLLKGQPNYTLNSPLTFNGLGAKFCYFWRVMLSEENSVVASNKKNTCAWIVKYFCFNNQLTKSISPFKASTTLRLLSLETPLKGKDIIDTSDFIRKN